MMEIASGATLGLCVVIYIMLLWMADKFKEIVRLQKLHADFDTQAMVLLAKSLDAIATHIGMEKKS